MARLLGHRQTKGAATDKPNLLRPRHIPTLPIAPPAPGPCDPVDTRLAGCRIIGAARHGHLSGPQLSAAPTCSPAGWLPAPRCASVARDRAWPNPRVISKWTRLFLSVSDLENNTAQTTRQPPNTSANASQDTATVVPWSRNTWPRATSAMARVVNIEPIQELQHAGVASTNASQRPCGHRIPPKRCAESHVSKGWNCTMRSRVALC